MSEALKNLYDAIVERKSHPREGSYTCYLFERGLDKMLNKIGSECTEAILAAKNGARVETVYEISDLIYHLMVLMVEQDIPVEAVLSELERRSEKIAKN